MLASLPSFSVIYGCVKELLVRINDIVCGLPRDGGEGCYLALVQEISATHTIHRLQRDKWFALGMPYQSHSFQNYFLFLDLSRVGRPYSQCILESQ